MDQNNGQGQNKQSGLSWSAPAAAKPVVATQKPVMPVPAKTTAAGSSQGGIAKYAGFIAAGVIAGVLVAWAFGAWRAPAVKTTTTPTNTTTSDTAATSDTATIDTTNVALNPALGSDPSLLVMSPQHSGMSVSITKAIVSEPTWVVVYENQAGKPGNALGATLFFPDHQAGTIALLRATTAGKSYFAVKQIDNGDHKFSLKDDAFLTENGEVQWVSFDVK